MFSINRFKTGVLKASITLKNFESKIMSLPKGSKVNLLSIKAVDDSIYFAIQHEQGLGIYPPSLFANNFKTFNKEVIYA